MKSWSLTFATQMLFRLSGSWLFDILKNIILLRIFQLQNIYSWTMLRKLKWQIPGELLAARYNWWQGPVPGRGPAVEKHCSRQDRWIQTELAFTLAKNATKPNPIEIIPQGRRTTEGRRNAGENSCNSGDGTDQTGPILDVYDDDDDDDDDDDRISLSGHFDGLFAETVLLGKQSTCTGSSLDWWSLPIRIFRYTVEGWSVCLLNRELLQSKQEGIIKFTHMSTLTFPMYVIHNVLWGSQSTLGLFCTAVQTTGVFRQVILQHVLVRLFYGNVLRFEVLTFLVHIEVFCDNAVRRLINIYRRFEESFCFGLWSEAVQISFIFK